VSGGGCGHGFFDVEGIAKLFYDLDRKILSKGILYKKEVLELLLDDLACTPRGCLSLFI